MLINPESIGWLKERANYRVQNLAEVFNLRFNRDNPFSTRNALDPFCNYDSLFYPLPFSGFQNYNGLAKAKIWLGDRLICLYLKHKQETLPRNIGDNVKDYLNESAAKAIYNYYSTVFPELKTSANQIRIWGINKPYFLLSELLLENRISMEQHNDNPREYFFFRALFFLDAYIFERWLETEKKEQDAFALRKLLEELNELVEVIAVSSSSLTTSTETQSRLLELFLEKSSSATKNQRPDISERKSNTANALDLSGYSFELRYFFLEIAIITILCNKIVSKQEIAFLEDFATRLHIHRDIWNQLVVSLIEILPNCSFHWQPVA